MQYYELSAKAGYVPAMQKLQKLEGMSWSGHEKNPEKAAYWSKQIKESEE